MYIYIYILYIYICVYKNDYPGYFPELVTTMNHSVYGTHSYRLQFLSNSCSCLLHIPLFMCSFHFLITKSIFLDIFVCSCYIDLPLVLQRTYFLMKFLIFAGPRREDINFSPSLWLQAGGPTSQDTD